MGANDQKIAHYESSYQPWDLIIATAMGFLEGNVVKYVSRWRRKDGAGDLKKALHYTNKLLEVLPQVVGRRGERIVGEPYALTEVRSFSRINGLTQLEERIVVALAAWRTEAEVVDARDDILLLLDEADPELDLDGTLPVGG